MLELWLVRHGQTDFSRENRFCGSIDPPLSDIGQRMAEALGESHGKDKWDAIYCSPSLRARQTATPLAKRAGRELVTDDGLREISYGDWEGMKHEEAKAKFPDVYAYWAQDTASRGTPNGESRSSSGSAWWARSWAAAWCGSRGLAPPARRRWWRVRFTSHPSRRCDPKSPGRSA